MVNDFDSTLFVKLLCFNYLTKRDYLDPYPNGPTCHLNYLVTLVGNLDWLDLNGARLTLICLTFFIIWSERGSMTQNYLSLICVHD